MNIPTWPRLAAATLVLLCLTFSLRAQDAQVYISDVQESDDDISLDVRVVKLQAAVGIQFSVGWDPNELEFREVTDIAFEGTFDGNFNQTEIDSGRIGYLVYDNSLEGLNMADSSLLFRLRFGALAGNGTTTALDFTESPVGISINNKDNDSIPVTLVGTQFTISMSTGLREVAAEDARFVAAPNPFVGSSRISYTLGYAGEADFEVVDASGRTVLRRRVRHGSGKNDLNLDAGNLPAAGTYILRLTTDREQLHRKVVLGRGGR